MLIILFLLLLKHVRCDQPICVLNSVPCNDNVGCYSLYDICNGQKECLDGTDEQTCTESTIHTVTQSAQSTDPTCTSGVTCKDPTNKDRCLLKGDICDGVVQCLEAFDESGCQENPYIIPTIISLTCIIIVIIIMCVLYKVCIYKFSSRYETNNSSSSTKTNYNHCCSFFSSRGGEEVARDVEDQRYSDIRKGSENSLPTEGSRVLDEDEVFQCVSSL